jgi:ribosomal protein S1
MAAERYPAGSVCRGRVTRQTSSGTYVAFADGVEGVIRSVEGGSAPAHGSDVEVRVVSLDPERERLELELLPAAVGVAE